MKATQLYRKHNGENSVTPPGEVNGRVSAAERTQLHRAFCMAAEQSGHKPRPLCSSLWGALQQDVQHRVLIVGLEDFKDIVSGGFRPGPGGTGLPVLLQLPPVSWPPMIFCKDNTHF